MLSKALIISVLILGVNLHFNSKLLDDCVTQSWPLGLQQLVNMQVLVTPRSSLFPAQNKIKIIVIIIIIVISKLLKRYSKTKRTRAPAYSRALRRIKGGFPKGGQEKLRSEFQSTRRGSVRSVRSLKNS